MYNVELTDTFGGEANYCWVKRAQVAGRDDDAWNPRREQSLVMRRAKAEMGMSGVRGVTHNMGDGYEFRPYGACVVMFVTWTDE